MYYNYFNYRHYLMTVMAAVVQIMKIIIRCFLLNLSLKERKVLR